MKSTLRFFKTGGVVATFLLLIVGCQPLSKHVLPGVTTPGGLQLEQLKRSEYRILGPVTARACESDGNVEGKALFSGGGGLMAFAGGGGVYADLEDAHKIALHQAMESLSDADILIHPKFYEDNSGPEPCVTVTAKAISIKTDEELGTSGTRSVKGDTPKSSKGGYALGAASVARPAGATATGGKGLYMLDVQVVSKLRKLVDQNVTLGITTGREVQGVLMYVTADGLRIRRLSGAGQADVMYPWEEVRWFK